MTHHMSNIIQAVGELNKASDLLEQCAPALGYCIKDRLEKYGHEPGNYLTDHVLAVRQVARILGAYAGRDTIDKGFVSSVSRTVSTLKDGLSFAHERLEALSKNPKVIPDIVLADVERTDPMLYQQTLADNDVLADVGRTDPISHQQRLTNNEEVYGPDPVYTKPFNPDEWSVSRNNRTGGSHRKEWKQHLYNGNPPSDKNIKIMGEAITQMQCAISAISDHLNVGTHSNKR